MRAILIIALIITLTGYILYIVYEWIRTGKWSYFAYSTIDAGPLLSPEILAKRVAVDLYEKFGNQTRTTNLVHLLHTDEEWELMWKEETAKRFGRALQTEAEILGFHARPAEPLPQRGEKNVPLSWKAIGSELPDNQ